MNYTMGTNDRKYRNAGFTYLGVLILVAILSIASVASLQIGSLVQRRNAEENLLHIGSEMQNAITSYINATPVGHSRNPTSLQDLLKDPRYPETHRYLRKLYADPITGKEEWGTIQSLDKSGIVGVFSLSDSEPIKLGNFSPEYVEFTGKTSYRDWKFVVSPNLSHQAQF
ncbi:type II secretion system protein [Collimonas arenae]|uniref:type II secretion system protein n=1 Tax=Collimonas arenae TaxID=279058 RepID=UPI001E465F2D|nr:type II secretion system protein [Collimonas arenae]